MRAEEAISVSNTYTENTVIGMGAIKGAPCTIKSITKSGNLNTVVFEWTDLENVKHESTMLVYDGADGTNGTDGADGFSPTIVVKSSTATEYILTITDKNGSYDTPNLKGSGGGGGASAMSDLTDVQLTSLANGQVLVYDGTASKWVNTNLTLSALADVDLTGIQDGQVLVWDDSANKFVPADQTGTEYTAGMGIDISANNEISTEMVMYPGTKAEWNLLSVSEKIKYTHTGWADGQSGIVDNVPTQNSDNLVKSGGVWTGLDAKADKTALTDYQTKNLSAPITVGGTQETTVEGAVGAINTLAAGKADPATSLSGYGITDAYTKTEADNAITTEIEKLDVSDSAVAGSYVTEVSETDGKISVVREAADAAPTSASNKMVKSGGVYDMGDNIYKANRTLGAKNLCKNEASTTTVSDGTTIFTFTVNEDKSVVVSAPSYPVTLQTNVNLPIWNGIDAKECENLIGRKVTLSGCPAGGDGGNNYKIQAFRATSIDGSSGTPIDSGEGTTFTWKNNASGIKSTIMIGVQSGYTMTGPLTFYPMIRLATDTDDTYQPYVPVNRDLLSYEDNAVLGAKNLLYHAGTQTTQGVLFQADDDGVLTVTRQSSSSSHAYYNNGRFLLKPGTYIFSNGYDSLPSGIQATYLYNFTDSAYFKNCNNGPIVFTLTEAKEFAFNIEVQTSQSPSGVKIYPMIRRFTDTDAAYTPFAKTNRQITQELTIEDHWSEAQVTGYTYFSGSYLKKYGKVVNLSFSVSQELAAGTEVKVLELPEGCRPFKNVIVPAYQNGTQYGYAWYKTNGDVTITPSEAKQWMGFSATFIAGN